MKSVRSTQFGWYLGLVLGLAVLGGAVEVGHAQDPGQGGVVSMPQGDLAQVTAYLNFDRVQPGQQVVVAVVLDVAQGYHAQSHKPIQSFLIPFALTNLRAEPGTAYEPLYPEGHIENYPALVMEGDPGDLSVYTGRAITYVPVEISKDASPGAVFSIRGRATYQICDANSCFAPETKDWELQVPIAAAGQMVTPANEALYAGFDPSVWSSLRVAADRAPEPAGSGEIASDTTVSLLGWTLDLTQAGVWVVLPLAFLAGIIFNIVPCVLPVLPLKAMGFYEVAQHNRAKCLALGVAFSLGIAATFAVLAVLVLVMQVLNWGELFSQWWFAAAVGMILFVMALYQFGIFEFVLPQSVYSVTPRHDTYTGNVLFGILTAILSTPCTFGLFAGLLVWAVAQPAWLGVSSVTVTGLGMAFPYLVLSAFPELARSFPRTGPWSDVVKQSLGFVLLAIAAYFVRPLLPDTWRGPDYWWVIFGLMAIGGGYALLRAMQLSGGRARPIVITAAIALVVLLPLGVVTHALANPPAGWVKFSPEELAEAREAGKPVLVKFTADWCANCQTVEHLVFGSQEQMDAWRDRGMTLIKADLTKPDAAGWPLLRELHPVGSIPFTAVYLPGEAAPRKLPGIYSSGDLERVLSNLEAQAAR